MRLGDLLEHPELGLRVLWATPEHLDRDVRWTYPSDLIDPGRYLSGGELILSGLAWRSSPDDAETFAAAMDAAGVAGVVAGDLVFGDVPDDVVDACRRHGVPVLGLDSAVSFVTVSEVVSSEVRTERTERRAAARGRHRELLSLLAAGEPLDVLVDRVSADTGHRCRVVTATGLPVTATGEPLPEADLDAVTAGFVTAADLPALVHGADRDYSVFSVGPGLGNRLTYWMPVADGDVAGWDLPAVEAVGELAALAQLDRTRRDEGRHALSQAASALFHALAGGAATPADVALRLTHCGIDPDAVLAVIAGSTADGALPGDEQVLIADAVAHLGPFVSGTWVDGSTVAVVEVSDDDYRHRLHRAVQRLAPGLVANPLSLGVSEPATAAGLAGAAEEARHALTVAQRGSGPVRLTGGDEIASAAVLLATVAPEVRAVFADRVLRTVREHDPQGQLIATLVAFLDHDGSPAATATALGVHVNTVRKRLERIEELTGRDLARLPDRIDFYLALQSD
ncbi:MAG: helix-turn-helix domain-containing protein [Gordonia sp. (in: high G+C Gram-positive bacteria)]|uniref:PucR family transcriptional regulator n=1 Tax=Gordonia sp. (in: high G+C Gram-positive bacteria) TaxID=84139 RepID=UPI0039E2B8D5